VPDRDSVLDVACGPGLVVCAFAPLVRHATGIDVTPAMLERAGAAGEKGSRTSDGGSATSRRYRSRTRRSRRRLALRLPHFPIRAWSSPR
jgi:SAM-dependent methyltransferase